MYPTQQSNAPSDNFEKKAAIYCKIFTEQFIREFNFLGDVVAGRATAKGDFTDKICSVVTFALTTVVDNSGIPFLGGVVDGVISTTVGKVSDKLKEKSQETIGKLYDVVRQEELRILVERVAMLAARRYQFFIEAELSDNPIEGVIPFAKAGMERCLEFIARKDLELNEENLLRGLIEGRSGAYISGFSDTQLAVKEPGKQKFTAEGVYGRSGFCTLGDDGQTKTFVLPRSQAKQKQQRGLSKEEKRAHKNQLKENLQRMEEEVTNGKASSKKLPFLKLKENLSYIKEVASDQFDKFSESLHDYGYSTFTEDTEDTQQGEPKYGYALVSPQVVEQYGYQPEVKRSKNRQLQLDTSPLRTRIATRADIEAYLKSGMTASFIDFFAEEKGLDWVTQQGKKITVVCEDNLSNLTLDKADFSDLDLSGATLKGCSAKGTSFRRCLLPRAQLSGLKAKGADFTDAHLEYANLTEADLTGANLTRAHFEFANLTKAQLADAAHFGSTWIGADVTDLKTTTLKVRAVQEKQSERSKLRVKELQGVVSEQGQKVEALQGVVSEQGQKIEEWTVQFQKELALFEGEIRGELKKEAQSVRSIFTDLRQEAQLRETFVTHFNVELSALKQQVEDGQMKDSKTSIAAIEKQLASLQEQQKEWEMLDEKVSAVITRLKKQDKDESLDSGELKALRSEIKTLSNQANAFSEAQLNRMDEVQTTLWNQIDALRGTIEEHTRQLAAYGAKLDDHENRLGELERRELEDKKAQPKAPAPVAAFFKPRQQFISEAKFVFENNDVGGNIEADNSQNLNLTGSQKGGIEVISKPETIAKGNTIKGNFVIKQGQNVTMSNRK